MPARPRVLCDPAACVDPAILPQAWVEDLALVPHPPDALLAGVDAGSVDGLLVRSVTTVDAEALAAMPRLRAVATLSSGVDHIDTAAVAGWGLPLATGRGGNARAVADWVEWALSRLWQLPAAARMDGRAVAVVGVGAVGSEVAARLGRRGARLLLVDPPRARQEATFGGVSLEDALAAGVDAVTLHVPRLTEGPDRTVGLLSPARLDRLAARRQPWVLLNAARAGLYAQGDVAARRHDGRLAGLACDVFECEPTPDAAFVAACDLATPHVAGHSVEGKLRVAWLALRGLRRALFGAAAAWPDAACEPMVAAAAQRVGVATAPTLALDQAAQALRAGAAGSDGFGALRRGHRRTEGDAVGASGGAAGAPAPIGSHSAPNQR